MLHTTYMCPLSLATLMMSKAALQPVSLIAQLVVFDWGKVKTVNIYGMEKGKQ